MSYDLDVWEGEQPTTDAELWQKIIDPGDMRDGRYLWDEQPDRLTPKIAEFMQALLRRWPDIGEECSPWKISGAGDTDGSTLRIYIQGDRADEVAPFVAGLAKVYGLVCLDCQTGRLRP